MRLFGHTIIAAAVAAGTLLLAPACADNDQSFYIEGVIAPPAREGNKACLYTDDAQQPQLFEGVVDVSLADSYSAVVLVGSQMITRADNIAPRTDPNRAKVTGAIIRVTDANDNTLGEFTSTSTGTVNTSQGGISAFGSALVTAIDSTTLQKVGAGVVPGQTKLVIANIKALGQTLGGVDLESAEYAFPIRVCNQCLIRFSGFDDPLTQGVDCNLQTQTGAGGGGAAQQQQDIPCSFGQDQVVPCTLCQGVEYPKGSGQFPCRGPT